VIGAAGASHAAQMKIRVVADLVLVAAGTLVLLVLVHDVYELGWSEHRLAVSAVWVAKHVCLAAVAALVFGSVCLRSAFKIAAASFCLAVIALVYATEIALARPRSAFGPDAMLPFWSIDQTSPEHKDEVAALARAAGVAVDTRSRPELLDDLRSQHPDAVSAVMLGEVLEERLKSGVTAGELMPAGGLSQTMTLLCNESGQYVTYESDEHGFRNPAGVWSAARADLALVGESPVQGYCVPEGKSFADLLRAHFPITLNLGVSGQSSLLQLAAIREYLPRYAPKVVLWVFSEGIDLKDLRVEARHPVLMRYLEPAFGQGLLERQPEIDRALRRVASAAERRDRKPRLAGGGAFVERSLGVAKLWHLRQKIDLMYGLDEEDDAEPLPGRPTHELLSRALKKAQTATRNWGGTLYVVYLPSWQRYRNGPAVFEREREQVATLAGALGIPFIDVQPAFQAQDQPLSLFPFRRFGHYNEKGNEVVADAVLTFLQVR
jgi:hypothetical protein